MQLKEVVIENFRSIKSLRLPMDGLTVLIGENNIGKSSILEAVRIALTRGFGAKRGGQFSEYDFHLNSAEATPQSADPISIVLHFAEINEDECMGCEACVGACPVEAISMNEGKAVVDAGSCIDCGACVGECPSEAISL